jgi:hypothetical protein
LISIYKDLCCPNKQHLAKIRIKHPYFCCDKKIYLDTSDSDEYYSFFWHPNGFVITIGEDNKNFLLISLEGHTTIFNTGGCDGWECCSEGIIIMNNGEVTLHFCN